MFSRVRMNNTFRSLKEGKRALYHCASVIDHQKYKISRDKCCDTFVFPKLSVLHTDPHTEVMLRGNGYQSH